MDVILKAISTVDSKLASLEQKDGQLIFCKDTRRILLDLNGVRTAYEQITTLNTESQRTEILAPIDGFYFVLETHILWRYSSDWIQITSQPAEIIYISDTYLDFPSVGNLKQIYIDTGNDAIYRWDTATAKYFCVGRDYNEIQIINGGGA